MTLIPSETATDAPAHPQRREVLARAAALPLLLLGAGAAVAQDPTSCPGIAGNAGMRKSLNFRLASPDPKKRCALCSFFKPGGAGCGTCQLLSGAGVAAGSLCDNYAPKG